MLSAVQELATAEQTQVPLEQTPEQQSLSFAHPVSLFVIQATQVDVVLSQTSPEQQSFVLSQPASPVGMHATQVMLVVSQLFEQQSASLEQAPSFAMQQLPMTHVCSVEHVETQAPVPGLHSKHWLASQGADRQVEPQTLAGVQHVWLLRHVWPAAQQKPLQHKPEQQVFIVHGCPAAVHGVTHRPVLLLQVRPPVHGQCALPYVAQ